METPLRSAVSGLMLVATLAVTGCSDESVQRHDSGGNVDLAAHGDGSAGGDGSTATDGSLASTDGSPTSKDLVGTYKVEVHTVYTQLSDPSVPAASGYFESELTIRAGSTSDLSITLVVAGVKIGAPEPKCTLSANVTGNRAKIIPDQVCHTDIDRPEKRTFEAGAVTLAAGTSLSMTAESTVEGTYKGKSYKDRVGYTITGTRK